MHGVRWGFAMMVLCFALSSATACGGSSSGLFDGSGEAGEGGTGASGGEGGTSGLGGTPSGGASGSVGTGGTGTGGSGAGGTSAGGSDAGGTSTGGSDAGGTSARGSGGTGPGGASGLGGTGFGGMGGTPSCTDSDTSTDGYGAYKTRGKTDGTNGSFEDTCSDDDNLIEQSCELACIGGPYPFGGAGGISTRIACLPQPTGRVIASTIPCGGRCVEGTCFQWCPSTNDTLTVDSVGERVRLSADSYTYDCDVSWQATGYDCRAAELVGRGLRVMGLGNCLLDRVTIALDDASNGGAQDCTFDCAVGIVR